MPFCWLLVGFVKCINFFLLNYDSWNESETGETKKGGFLLSYFFEVGSRSEVGSVIEARKQTQKNNNRGEKST